MGDPDPAEKDDSVSPPENAGHCQYDLSRDAVERDGVERCYRWRVRFLNRPLGCRRVRHPRTRARVSCIAMGRARSGEFKLSWTEALYQLRWPASRFGDHVCLRNERRNKSLVSSFAAI